jgi:ABC-type ATPase involved in cell division
MFFFKKLYPRRLNKIPTIHNQKLSFLKKLTGILFSRYRLINQQELTELFLHEFSLNVFKFQ